MADRDAFWAQPVARTILPPVNDRQLETPIELDHGAGMLDPLALRSAFAHYPTGVAVVVMDGDQILLGRRRWSYAGAWCIPCGHVEWDEDIRDAAVREGAEPVGHDNRRCPTLI